MARMMTAAVAAAAIGCAGQDRIADPTNELPRGVIDMPAQGALLQPGPTVVGGWALDDSGVTEIRIYFDGRFVARTTPMVPRPDVAKAFPAYARPGDVYGWNIAVDFAATAGDHTIMAQAVDTHGATRDISSIAVRGHR